MHKKFLHAFNGFKVSSTLMFSSSHSLLSITSRLLAQKMLKIFKLIPHAFNAEDIFTILVASIAKALVVNKDIMSCKV